MCNRTEAKLTEYNALREEINNTYNHQQTMFIFILSAMGAIASFALQQKNPWITLIAFIVLLPTSAIFHNYSKRVILLSTYIRLFIESEVVGLSWESKANEWRQNAIFPRRDIKNYIFTIVAVLLYIQYIILLWVYTKNDYFGLWVSTLIPIFIILLIWDSDYRYSNRKIVEKYNHCEQYWETIKISGNKEDNT